MEAKSNGAASRLLRLLAGTCFAWAFVAIATAFALNYGVGLYGAGLYNVGALASTTTTLSSSLNPSTFGSGVTLTAAVTPSTATGTLTFKDGSTTLGTITLGHASGSLTTSALTVGSHALTAVYGGNLAFSGSTSNTLTQTVNLSATFTVLTSSLNPSTYGSGVLLRAAVTPATATGTLTFKDGATTIGSATLGHGSGSLTTSALSAGTHSMTAVYAGNVNYAGGTSNTLSQTVAKAASTTVLVSSLNPSTFGSGVTLTATVSPASATGTLTFKDGATTISSVTLGHGSGSMTASALAVGSHSLTAVYGGNSNFNTSTSAVVSQAVNSPTGLSSSTTLTSSLNPSTFGSGVTLRVAVTPSSATGSVAFLDHGVTLAVVTLGHGSGSYTTSALPARSHDLTAMYGGNGTYLSSTSNTLTQVVNQAGSTTILASSLNPSTFGSGVWLTASVTPSTATGTVSFKEGATTLGVVTLGHGSGRLLISTPTAGSHPLTAVYAGNVNFLTSTSPVLTQTVTRAASTTTLTSSLNPTTFGSGVTLRAAVSPATATGTVTFQDGSTTIGTTTLGHGSGSVTVSTLSAGSHSLTAVYAGNVNYAASTSNTVTQIVNRAATAVGLVSGTNPSAAGVTVTFTATTISTATGAVTFLDGLVTLGSATLSSGTASYGLSSLAVGSHAVTAVYGGNVNYLSGTSAVLTQVVTAATGGGGGGGGGGGSTTTDSGGGGGTRRSTTQSSSSAAPALQAAADNTSNVLPAQGSKLLVTIDGNQVVFRDVPVDSWYAAFVSELVQAGIVSGYRDAQGQPTGFFGPQNAVTYGESLKMALTAAQKRLSSGVPQNRSARGDWSAPYVKTAEELHLSVYLSALDVRKPAIRGAVIETLLEAFGVTIAPATNPFTDLPSSDPHAAAIETAAALGIVAGDTNASGKPKGTVRPNAPVNRAEVAKIVSLLRKATGR